MFLLFSCRRLIGHLHPLLPLAQAAVERGHDVLFATNEPALSDAREHGFATEPCGPGAEARAMFERRNYDLRSLTPAEMRMRFYTDLFVRLEAPPRLQHLTALIERRRPDVIVHELAEPAAPIAAVRAGIPYVTSGYGPLPPPALLEAATETIAEQWEDAGLQARGLFAPYYLDPCPPLLQRSERVDVDVHPVRLTPAPAPPVPHDAPTVYVTFGTVWNHDEALIHNLLSAFDGRPEQAFATLGAHAITIGELPPNVDVHGFVPQAEVLPRCDAVIAHGGSGTMLGALAHGLPLLLFPQGADQFDNAALVEAAGAGFTQSPLEPLGLDRLLGDAGLRRGAQAVAAELAAMPEPAAAIELLEGL